MSNGVESFAKLAEMGALYPFQGSEGLLVILCTAFWLAWHIWQLKSESDECNIEIKEIKGKAEVNKALDR